MTSRGRVWVVGSLNADLVQTVDRFPVPGETLRGGDLRCYPGGKGANQAYAAARLGADTIMVGNVGGDQFGTMLVDSLAGAGVDCARIATVDVSTGAASIFVDPGGQNSIVISPGANATLRPADVRMRLDGIAEGDFLMCQLESPVDTVLEAMQVARDQGATTILDPAPATEFTDEFYACAQFLTPNEVEANTLLRSTTPASTGARILAQRLLQLGVDRIVLKCGAAGCYYADSARELSIDGHSVTPVDSTGAGDAFNGALAARLASGADVREALRSANAAAAICVTKAGAQPSMPAWADVREFLNGVDAANANAQPPA